MENQELNINPFVLEEIMASDIKEVVADINKNIDDSDIKWSKGISGKNKYWLDKDNMIKLKDSIGNKVFSINIQVDGYKQKSIFNLIRTKRKKGDRIKPFVMEYEFENQQKYVQYLLNDSASKVFEGIVHTYSLKEFKKTLDFSKTGSAACGSAATNSGTSSGNSRNNTSSSTPGRPSAGTTSGSYAWASMGTTTMPLGSSTGNGGGGRVEVGEGYFGKPQTNQQKNSSVYGKSSDCPKGRVFIPINLKIPWKKIVIESEGEKIDPKEELKCFDEKKSGKITIYVRQPTENTEKVMGENQVGHVFIGLEQNGVKKHFGFYPPKGASDLGVGVGYTYDSELRDNSESLFHVSISTNIDATQMKKILNYAKNYPKEYQLQTYACTEFGIEMGNLAGLNLPKTTVKDSQTGGLLFKGRSPGKLGQEIRAMKSDSKNKVVKTKGKSPAKSKEKC